MQVDMAVSEEQHLLLCDVPNISLPRRPIVSPHFGGATSLREGREQRAGTLQPPHGHRKGCHEPQGPLDVRGRSPDANTRYSHTRSAARSLSDYAAESQAAIRRAVRHFWTRRDLLCLWFIDDHLGMRQKAMTSVPSVERTEIRSAARDVSAGPTRTCGSCRGDQSRKVTVRKRS